MTKVKICGLTREEDARAAVSLGAWALGMIMWPASPRYVAPERAAAIADAHRRSAEVAGVFVDQPLDEVVNLTNEIGLTIVQLHGDEGQQYCKAIAQRTGAKITKAFRIRDRSTMAEIGKFWNVDYHLVDSYKSGVPGGTGETFDWNYLTSAPQRSEVPLILSGGLTPSNVAAAIEKVRPYAVDVASGVESEPGVKDHELMSEFFEAVKTIETEPEEAPITGAEEEVLTLKYYREQQEQETQEQETQ